jgi:hypothetical protein
VNAALAASAQASTFGGAATVASGSAIIDGAQGFAVDGLAATLGIILGSLTIDVQGSGGTAAIDIATQPNVKAVFDSTSTYTLSSASITSGQASDASFTKTTCTAVSSGVGTQSRVAVVSGAPVVSQAIANCQQIAALMVPLVLTSWFSYESIQWVVLEARASTAANCAFFDIQNGAVGRTDAGMTAASITPETRNGVAGYRVSVTVTGCSSTLTARFGLSTTDTTVTNPAAATTILQDNFTVSQVRVAAVRDRKTNTDALVQATVNLQPGYVANYNGSGQPARRYYGAQYMLDTEATHYGAVDGADAEHSVHIVGSFDVADATNTLVGAGNSGVATNQCRTWGGSITGSGRYRSLIIDDTPTTSNVDSANTCDTSPHVHEWYTSSAGTSVNLQLDGAAPDAAFPAAQNVGTVTMNRMAEGCRPNSSPLSLLIGTVAAWVVTEGAPDTAQNGRVTVNLGAQYGITVAP